MDSKDKKLIQQRRQTRCVYQIHQPDKNDLTQHNPRLWVGFCELGWLEIFILSLELGWIWDDSFSIHLIQTNTPCI